MSQTEEQKANLDKLAKELLGEADDTLKDSKEISPKSEKRSS